MDLFTFLENTLGRKKRQAFTLGRKKRQAFFENKNNNKKVVFMDPAIITLCVLAVAAFLFVTELIPLAVTAMAACTALGIAGSTSV